MAQLHDNNNYSHIAANGTTVVKASPGTLHAITINTKGASANIATVYDGAAASNIVIAVIDTTSAVQTLRYNVQFLTNLTVVVATGTAADLTVCYQ